MKKSVKRMSAGDMTFTVANTLLMLFLCFIMLYPMLYVFGRSFMGEVERALNPYAIVPQVIDWGGYKYVFSSNSIVPQAFLITIARTLLGTLANMFFTALLAYVMSRPKYPLRTPLTMFVVFTMWLNAGTIPNYLLIKELGLINQFSVYILPGLISVWNLVLLRNFFAEIPIDLEESAVIDGASEPTLLFKIYLPLSTASLATVALFYAVTHWNSWFDAVMYVSTNKSIWTLQMVLREVVNNAFTNSMMEAVQEIDAPPTEQIQFATITVAVFPILITYPFLQKYFVKGVLVGSLKG